MFWPKLGKDQQEKRSLLRIRYFDLGQELFQESVIFLGTFRNRKPRLRRHYLPLCPFLPPAVTLVRAPRNAIAKQNQTFKYNNTILFF